MIWALVTFGLLTGAVLWLRRTYAVVTVDGASMQPTFETGDRVLVRRTPVDAIRRNDVVVIGRGTEHLAEGVIRVWLIKRAVAVPGDPVPRDQVVALRDVPHPAVPPGKIVLLGDNSEASYDSRVSGYFAADSVLGVVVRRLSEKSEPPRL